MPRLYHAADLVVLPSQREGFPLVVKETLACGRPLICSSDVASADPSLSPFIDVVDIAHHSDESGAAILSQTIDRVLKDLPNRDARVRDAAIFAKSRYSWETCAKNYEAICLEIGQP